MKIVATIKEICAKRGLKASGFEVVKVEMTENDDVCRVEVSFWIDSTHQVSEHADDLDDLFTKVTSIISKIRPVVHITDSDYELMAERVLSEGFRQSIQTTTEVEIPKGKDIFFFTMISQLWQGDKIVTEMYDDCDNEVITDFCTSRFYEILEKMKAKRAA